MNDLKAFHEMRSKKIIHIISSHAEGEVGDVIVGGVSPPPGESIWEQSRWIDQDQSLRRFVLNEPRGGVFRHANLLVKNGCSARKGRNACGGSICRKFSD